MKGINERKRLMNTQALTVEIEPELVERVDEVANLELKRRDDVIREALTRHVQQVIELADFKPTAAERYLAGQLSFDHLARIVGFDDALTIRESRRVLEESIAHAQEDSQT